ncbi:hypothetical protein AB0945_42670 [Streptomyces sp. NPDC005474]|uniref:hypothetical protein n=1 Tax=Streptomyces sp. NPDC005474 TaxID=3154878 RepID=UPI003454315F
MTAIRVVRRHTAVRVSPTGRESRTDLVLWAESGAPGEWRLAVHPADTEGAEEAGRAHAAWRVLAEKSRPVLREDALLVEAGRTGTEIECDGRTVLTHDRAYLLVRDGDHVLHLGDGAAPGDALPWVRAADPDEIRADDPVLFGPSALLALTAAVQEARGGFAPDDPSAPPAVSPYPPHDLSLPLLPPELTDGRNRADLDQACELLGDPALWLVPHGTFGEFAAGDRPDADAGRLPVMAPPPRALIVDSLAPRARTTDGVLDWTAAYRVRDSTGTGRGTGPLRVRGAPAELLSAAEARHGPRRPGLGRDPIGRARYRLAPTVGTSLNAGRTLAP